MAQRRHHYEAAFEHLMRSRRVPCIAVDEAKKSLIPMEKAEPRWTIGKPESIKSFDFVVYGRGTNLLIEVKGRRLANGRRRAVRSGVSVPRRIRQECWVTQDDVDSLMHWQGLFGPEFEAVFVFLYACDEQPADVLHTDAFETFEHGGVWYCVKCVPVNDYYKTMKTRSSRWRTVDLRQQDFRRLARPLMGCRSGLAGEFDQGPDVPLLEIA